MSDHLLIYEPPFQVLPSLASAVGLYEATILQEIHYLLDPKANTHFFENRYWVPNVSKQLQSRFSFWGEENINIFVTRLEKLGVLMSFVPDNSDPNTLQNTPKIKYHTIDYQRLTGDESYLLEEGDKKLCRLMIKIWNKRVQNKIRVESETILPSKRERYLIQFLESILGRQHSWETYCEQISQQSFVGKVSLNWALMPGVVHNIMKPSKDKDELQDKPWKDFFEEIKESLRGNPYDEKWFQIAQTLAKRLGKAAYRTWFLESTLAEFSEKNIVLQVDSAFKKEYLRKFFLLDLAYAVQAAYPKINRIDFQIIGENEGGEENGFLG